MNCEAYSSFEYVSSDHRIVKMKIGLNLRRNKKQSKPHVTTRPHLPIEILVIYIYTATVRNKFDILQEISKTHTPNIKSSSLAT